MADQIVPIDINGQRYPIRSGLDPEYVARLARAWVKLARTPRADRRLALVLSDYPARGGRKGYAVGLDSVESVLEILVLLRSEGYDTGARDWRAEDIERLLHRRQPFLRCGKVIVLLQPDRGGAYHDNAVWVKAASNPPLDIGVDL